MKFSEITRSVLRFHSYLPLCHYINLSLLTTHLPSSRSRLTSPSLSPLLSSPLISSETLSTLPPLPFLPLVLSRSGPLSIVYRSAFIDPDIATCLSDTRRTTTTSRSSHTTSSESSVMEPRGSDSAETRHSSSYRHTHGSVLVVGSTPIREICEFQKSLQDKKVMMDCLLVPDNCEVAEWIDDSSVRIVQVSSAVMKKLSRMQSIESIEAMALMRIPTSFSDINADEKEANCKAWFPCPHQVLVLDGVKEV